MQQIMESDAIQQVSTHLCSRLLRSPLAAAASLAPLMMSAHIIVLCAARPCFSSHRSSMLLQQ
jgi:hypothetical protein